MPIVSIEDFHPHTGAYWMGYKDAWTGLPKSPPSDWELSSSFTDYDEGYDAAIKEIEAEYQKRQAPGKQNGVIQA